MALTAALDTFTEQTKRNITAVLKMQGMFAKDAARAIGMSDATFSQRLNGASRWLAAEIQQLAEVLDVDPGVLLAVDEQQFRKRLATSARLFQTHLTALPSMLDRRYSSPRNSPPLLTLVSDDDIEPQTPRD